MNDEFEAGQGRAVPADGAADAVDSGPPAATNAEATESVDLAKVGSSPFRSAQVGSGDVGSGDDSPGDESDDELLNGSDRESALVGASSAGSARAAARRSAVRTGSTPVKGVATKSRDLGRETRVGLIARLRRFLREVVAELRKVIWPARNQMVTYTVVVIVFVVFMVALTAGLDVLFARGVLAVFG